MHKLLVPTTTAIRLLYVQPELHNTLIQCSLRNAEVTDSYVALSYVCGTDLPSHSIWIDGVTFKVRENLYYFLAYARRFYADKPLWVDAICINQEDLDEKNYQVRMMSRIYKNADIVIWLGDGYDGPISLFKELAALFVSENEFTSSKKSMTEGLLPIGERGSSFWRALEDVLYHVYWSRCWCLQEWLLARNLCFVQGEDSVEFEDFLVALQRVSELFIDWHTSFARAPAIPGTERPSRPPGKDRMDAIWESPGFVAADLRGSGVAEDESYWSRKAIGGLDNNAHRFSWDIKDRIFSMLGLSTHNFQLQVDYHLGPFQLSLETLWLELMEAEGEGEARFEALNVLHIWPELIWWYAPGSSATSGVWSQQRPSLDEGFLDLHLRSGSSQEAWSKWVDACYSRTRPDYIAGDEDGEFMRWDELPTREAHESFPAGWRHVVVWRYTVSLRKGVDQLLWLAMYAPAAVPATDAFLQQAGDTDLLRGVYKTQCTPEIWTILFVLEDYIPDGDI